MVKQHLKEGLPSRDAVRLMSGEEILNVCKNHMKAKGLHHFKVPEWWIQVRHLVDWQERMDANIILSCYDTKDLPPEIEDWFDCIVAHAELLDVAPPYVGV